MRESTEQSKSNGSSKATNDCGQKKDFGMIIDILFNVISESSDYSQLNTKNDLIGEQTNHMTFDDVSSKYGLDFKQRVAFEFMAWYFTLKSLQKRKTIENEMYTFFGSDSRNKNMYLDNLSTLKKQLDKKKENII